jgi:branched-chain amino acid transport system substrate-binding protein
MGWKRALRVISSATLTLLAALSVARADEFVIGVINPMTGPGADMGIWARRALEPAVAELNAQGGINGIPIRVIFRDDESNPQKGVASVYELIQRQHVNMIMGAQLTHVAAAISPIINQAKVPFIVFGTGAALIDPAKLPYSFRFNMTTEEEASVLVSYAEKNGWTQPAYLVDPTAYGQSGEKMLNLELAKQNLKPVAVETFSVGDTDMTGQFITLQKASPNVLFVWGLGTMLAQAARSADRVAFDRPVLGSIGMHQEGFVELAGPAGKKWAGTFFRAFTRSDTDPAPERTRAFVDKIAALYGSQLNKSMSTIMSAAPWDDAIRAIVGALNRTGAKTGDDIKAALESAPPYHGILTTYAFSPQKHDGFDERDIAIAYALGVERAIRLRVPEAP